jgi:hypothetical protein
LGDGWNHYQRLEEDMGKKSRLKRLKQQAASAAHNAIRRVVGGVDLRDGEPGGYVLSKSYIDIGPEGANIDSDGFCRLDNMALVPLPSYFALVSMAAKWAESCVKAGQVAPIDAKLTGKSAVELAEAAAVAAAENTDE